MFFLIPQINTIESTKHTCVSLSPRMSSLVGLKHFDSIPLSSPPSIRTALKLERNRKPNDTLLGRIFKNVTSRIPIRRDVETSILSILYLFVPDSSLSSAISYELNVFFSGQKPEVRPFDNVVVNSYDNIDAVNYTMTRVSTEGTVNFAACVFTTKTESEKKKEIQDLFIKNEKIKQFYTFTIRE